MANAASRHSLLGELKERGLTVVEIRELRNGASEHPRPRGRWLPSVQFGVVGLGELSIFWREFATMVAAGLPSVEALESITVELENPKLRRALQNVTAAMWEGFNLSQGLGRHPHIFSPMTIALISAAEESGSLSEVSQQLATYLENRDRLMHKVRAALTYPIFLCGFFTVVLAIATFWLIPKFRDIYTGFGAKLPWLTETVFTINAFVLHYVAWMVAGVAAAALLFVLWARRPAGRAVIDRVLLTLPIFGPLLQRAAIARLCRSLAILLSGGIPINRGLELAQETSGNSVVAAAIRRAREEILKGNKIASSFKAQRIFPHMLIRMIATGEETGNLSRLLEKMADFYEGRVDAALTTINALIEPVMIVVIGAFVLIFVLSMYLPIFKLAATVHG